MVATPTTSRCLVNSTSRFSAATVPAGLIRNIDVGAARALPGVHAVLTGADLNPVAGPLVDHDQWPADVRSADACCSPSTTSVSWATRSRWWWPSSRYIAEDACELIEVDIEPTPAAATLEQAMADGAPLVHPELGTNVLDAPRTR